MFFSKFKKPKWQHRSAEIRKEALLTLKPGDADFDQIIQELSSDSEVDIRKLAVERLNQYNHLEKLLTNESNSDVIKVAKGRMINMISGTVDCELSAENRLAKVYNFENTAEIEAILKKTKDADIKKALLPRISRISILESMAVNSNDINLQLEALEKINEQAALERIIKKCRTKNKKITKAAKEKLEQIIIEQEKPKEIEKQRKAICLSLETINQKGYDERFNTEYQRLTSAWNDIDFPCDQVLQQKYSTAKDAADKILQQFKAEEVKRQEDLKQQEQISAAKNQLIEDLKAALSKAQNQETISENLLQESEARWKELGNLPAKEEDKLSNDFYSVRKQISRLQTAIEKANDCLDEALEFIKRIDSALEENFISTGKLKGIQRKGKAFKIDPLLSNPPQHLVDVNTKLNKLEDKFNKQEKNIEAQRKELPSILDSMEKDLDAGSITSANNHLKKARKIIKNIPSLDSKTKNRFNALSAKASQLQDWKGWATTPKKEELCKEMETLAESTANTIPEELAQNIKLLQDRWKKLGASEPNSSQELWERFSSAADKAYAPCKEYYAEQSKQRQQNQEEREAVCADMEKYYAETNWESPDWKKVDSYLSRSIDAWKKCGATDRKMAKTLTERYRKAQDNIKGKLDEYRTNNKNLKLEIIEQAQDTANIEDVFQAVERIKVLQKDWKDIGPTFRKEEQKIWNDFRAVCDQVFAKRQEIFDASDSERNANLENKNNITEQIENIAQISDEEFATAKQDLEELKQQWKEISNIPKSADKECYQRFKDACQAVIDKETSIQDAAAKQKDEAFQQKLDICTQLEASLLDNHEVNTEELEAKWQGLQSTHKQQDNILNRRFRDNIGLAVSQDKEKISLLSQQSIQSAELICIKAEIAANIDTPQEYAIQRREYQVSNLAEGMKNSTPDPKKEIDLLYKDFISLNLIPTEKVFEFLERIEKAKG